MRPSPIGPACLAVLALALAHGAARLAADEPPPPAAPAQPAVPTPQERAAKVLAALPPPKAGEAWTFDAEVLIGGIRQGQATLRLEAVHEDETDLWKATERVRFGVAERPAMSIDLDATVDASLVGLYGTTTSAGAQGKTVVKWKRMPVGYGFEKQVDDHEAEKAMVPAQALRASLGGMVRFCMALPREPAVYVVMVLNQDANTGALGDNRAKEVTLTVEGEKEVAIGSRKGKAWVVTAKDRDGERTLAFDPKDRSLLSLEKPAARLLLRRKGLVPPPLPASAQEAAMLAARAFGLSDYETLRELTWWPAVTEQFKDNPSFAGMDADGRRVAILTNVANRRAAATPEMIDMGLEMVRGQVVQEDAGEGRVRFRFPAMFQNLEIAVQQQEGAWRLVQYPTKTSAAPPK